MKYLETIEIGSGCIIDVQLLRELKPLYIRVFYPELIPFMVLDGMVQSETPITVVLRKQKTFENPLHHINECRDFREAYFFSLEALL